MATNLTGGLDVTFDYLLPEAPAEPGLREAVNIWAWDDAGEIGIPRVAIEAVAPDWSHFDISLNMTFPDGRTLRYAARDPALPTRGPDGKPTILSAGPLTFECIEPFVRHRVTYKGVTSDSTYRQMAIRQPGDKQADVAFELEYEPVVPPWQVGALSTDAAEVLNRPGSEKAFMGGERFEQLCRANGTVTIDGMERAFSGHALRIRRRGVRNDSGFWGHCWQSAVFPGGRAFGFNAFPPRGDGVATYNEGFLFLGDGELIPARLVEASWLTRCHLGGDDVSFVLESRLGRTRIEGVTVSGMPLIGGAGQGSAVFPPLVEAIARYRWDGEEAYGMIERSNLPENVTLPM